MNDASVIYEFDGRRVDPARRELSLHGKSVALFPRCFDALVLLIERRGEVLDKDCLLKALWPGVVVEENSLAKLISELRRALNEGAREPGCIVTVPKHGYRFTAEVAVVLREERPPPRRTGPGSLAVLPFAFVNPRAGDEILGLGLADALITRLGRMRHTLLRPTSSIARFAAAAPREAGLELGVDAVITGSMRRSGDTVRVSVQLVSVADDAVSWAEKFDVDARDALMLEDQVAERVADALSLALARADVPPDPRRYTNDAVAYSHYVRGRYLWTRRTRESLLQAVDCFERAIAIDPHYALAYSGLGDCWIHLGLRAAVARSMRPRETMPKARTAAEKALALDDSLAAAHATLGQVLFFYEWRRADGMRELMRALELEPNNPNANHWYAMALSGMTRYDEALVQIRRALAVDPLSVLVNANYGFVLYRAGRHEEAIAQLRHAVDMEPGAAMVRYRFGLALGGLDRHEEALEQFQAMNPTPEESIGFTGIARSLALLGRRAEAQTLLERIHAMARVEYLPAIHIADVHAALGNRDLAFEMLELALEERSIVLLWFAFDRNWQSLRDDARFTDFLRRMGL